MVVMDLREGCGGSEMISNVCISNRDYESIFGGRDMLGRIHNALVQL